MRINEQKVIGLTVFAAVLVGGLVLLRRNSHVPVSIEPSASNNIQLNRDESAAPLAQSTSPAPAAAKRSDSAQTTAPLWVVTGKTTGEKLNPKSASYAKAQQDRVKLQGRSSPFDPASLTPLAALQRGDNVVIPLLGGEQVAGKVNLVQLEAGGWVRVGGELTGLRAGSFSLASSGNKVGGTILLPQEQIAYTIAEQSDGKLVMQEKPLSDVICFPIPRPKNEPANSVQSLGPQESPPILSSRPTAAAVLYLDFDGETVTDPSWNGGNTIVAQPSSLSSAQMTEVWNRVKEDYWSFDIDVTTDRNRYNNAQVGHRMRCIITPTDTAAPGTGGVAYLSSFDQAGNLFSSTIPCWVFMGSTKAVAEAVSHEFGHTFGLHHDGRTSPMEVYYAGHGTGAVGWAPIMGVGYYKELVQWSKGEYANANSQEDDIAIIANAANGFGFVADDAGNSQGSAATLNVSGGAVNQTGIISGNNDADFYVFNIATTSVVNINANPISISPNLDVLLQLQNSAGTVLASSNPDTALNATIISNLVAGNYYIKIQGTGRGNVLGDGYSSYGSIGHYLLSGSINPLYGQQGQNYNSGTYSEIFETNPPAVFSLVNGQGLSTTRGIQPLNTQYSLNYLRKGPFDLSVANATLEISTFFKVSRPTSSGLGFPTLQLGFAQDHNATSFFSDGTISWWLYPKDTIDTGSGFHFETVVSVEVPGMGFSWGTTAVPILKSNNWYKATLQVSRVNSTTLSIWGTIDDYGTSGHTFLVRVDTTGTDTATGSATYPFTSFTTDSTMYPALHGMSSGGLNVVDDTAFVKTQALITLGSLSQTYNGSARSATATTSPAGLTVYFTYNGSSNAPTNAGSYSVIGTIFDVNYHGSATGTLVINPLPAAPTITTQPQSQTNNAGTTATFSVSATGASPLSYQWRKDGVNLSSATNITLNITNVQPMSIGYYSVVVINPGGTVTSSNASLSIPNVPTGIWQGLVAYYPFNGNANDESGYKNDGTLVGNDRKFSFDRFGEQNSLFLNTTSSPSPTLDGAYVSAPRSPGLDFKNSFTLSVWMNIPDTVPGFYVHNILSGGQDSTSGNLRAISAGGTDYLQFVCVQAGDTNYNAVVVPAIRSKWWQFGVVRAGTNLSLFRNGVLIASSVMSTNLDNNPTIWLGRHIVPGQPPGSGSYSMIGGIDDVRMYNRALASNEVAQLYSYENLPALGIVQQGGNVQMSWPVTYRNYTLLSSSVLTGGAWITNTSPQTISGNNVVVTVTPTNSRMFYRLKSGQ